jgi:hypothetical protein
MRRSYRQSFFLGFSLANLVFWLVEPDMVLVLWVLFSAALLAAAVALDLHAKNATWQTACVSLLACIAGALVGVSIGAVVVGLSFSMMSI